MSGKKIIYSIIASCCIASCSSVAPYSGISTTSSFKSEITSTTSIPTKEDLLKYVSCAINEEENSTDLGVLKEALDMINTFQGTQEQLLGSLYGRFGQAVFKLGGKNCNLAIDNNSSNNKTVDIKEKNSESSLKVYDNKPDNLPLPDESIDYDYLLKLAHPATIGFQLSYEIKSGTSTKSKTKTIRVEKIGEDNSVTTNELNSGWGVDRTYKKEDFSAALISLAQPGSKITFKGLDDVKVGAGMFKNCVKIQVNSGYSLELWIAKDLGMIKKIIDPGKGPDSIEILELFDFNKGNL